MGVELHGQSDHCGLHDSQWDIISHVTLMQLTMYRCFGLKFCLLRPHAMCSLYVISVDHAASVFRNADFIGSRILRNINYDQPDYTASHP
jgi:hypothetical protein